MSEVHTYLGAREDTCLIKLEGDVSYLVGPELEALFDEVLERVPCGTVCVDLTCCSKLDSTGLGLLARIGGYVLRYRGRRAVIVCGPGDVRTTLEAVGFDAIFDLQLVVPFDPPHLHELMLPRGGRRELGRVILEAHKELIAIDERNRRVYSDIVDLLEQQLAAKSGASA